MPQLKKLKDSVEVHEAGHTIAALEVGGYPYGLSIKIQKGERGRLEHGTRKGANRARAIIAVSGVVAEILKSTHFEEEVDVDYTISLLNTEHKYGMDRRVFKMVERHEVGEVIKVSETILHKRRSNLLTLAKNLTLPKNRDRRLNTTEILDLSNCEILDDKKEVIPPRKWIRVMNKIPKELPPFKFYYVNWCKQ